MDHHQFDEEILDKATKAILRTRDGKLRAAVPSPLGNCVFLNDVSMEEMYAALKHHKAIMKQYPRNGEGLEAFVDASDTGYTVNNKPIEAETNGVSNGVKKLNVLNDDTCKNGHSNTDGKNTNGVLTATKHASGPEGVNGIGSGMSNDTTNGFMDGVVNGMNGHRNDVKVQA
jgi:3-dehydroquinate synthase